MTLLKDPGPVWPAFIFEPDGYFIRINSAEGLKDLYEDDMWDEVEAAFDAELFRLEVDMSAPSFNLVRTTEKSEELFVYWARKGLKRAWKETRFRVIRASPAQQQWLDSLDANALLKHLLNGSNSAAVT